MKRKTYISIDLKSFYASVECMELGLDPMTTNLIVADASRTQKTICLAVTPSLKEFGIPGRPRLFEVEQKVKEINAMRQAKAPGRKFTGSSSDAEALKKDKSLKLEYIIAPPRMAHYIEYSTRIYDIYLKYVADEDIHVYSIDEVFMDVTNYLEKWKMNAREFASMILKDVYSSVGITATAGIGSNMYLCKVAMDILAKHADPDENGVRIAELTEESYRRKLWHHQPITDFWRVGKGYARKLKAHGMNTMGDVARCSIGKKHDFYNEDLLYKLFGVNAELLIDHAWGWEPCTISEIKKYRPEGHSLGSGQVLQEAYDYKKARLVVREMTDLLVLDLVNKKLVTDQMTLTVGYDIENLTDPRRRALYHGEITTDAYGRQVPKHAHGTVRLGQQTSSTSVILKAVTELFEDIVDKNLLVRRINIAANNIVYEDEIEVKEEEEQLQFFVDYDQREKENKEAEEDREKEKAIQHALINIKEKYGKNAIIKGMNLEEGATARGRNRQIGGHKA
ncbi:MAG: DNA methylase [Eubacterium sp.]|nr:DNA methylase [Eubacterium sp.]